MDLQAELKNIINTIDGYKFGPVEITSYQIRGNKMGFAHKWKQGADKITGRIVIDSDYAAWGAESADNKKFVLQTIRHEVAHLIAETVNTKAKGVWHGAAWKAIFAELGGNAERYNTSGFVKPGAKPVKTMEELRKIKPTRPATDWERGTFRQWLERGYHVMKGQKGERTVWQFVADEYETAEDGKTSKFGRASAVYFTPDQVAPNN